MNIEKQLRQWLTDNSDNLTELGFSINLIECKPTVNPAVHLTIDTDTIVAGATIWGSLDLNFEAIEGSSGKELIAENHHANDWTDVCRLLDDFFVRLNALKT